MKPSVNEAKVIAVVLQIPLVVLNFAVLARQYFKRYYFRDFNRQ